MRVALSRVVLASTLLLLVLTAPRPAAADWPLLGRALTTAPGNQDRAHVVLDGAGGAIVTWQEFGAGSVDIFAQHVLGSGELDAAWPVNGRALLTDAAALATAKGGQALPVIVADGAGGAIVAWEDERNELHVPDVFAQHVLASGAVDPNWPANGAALSTAAGAQSNLTIVSDGAGGAIVAWMDGRAAGSGSGIDLYAQHVLASGQVDPDWPANGAAIATAPSTQWFPRAARDGAGGAIITWFDFRNGVTTGLDVYAQRVRASGTVDPAWPVNGRALSLDIGNQFEPTIVSDNAHGAIVSWTDDRDGTQHIYAQRVSGTGAIAPGWPTNGLAVCTAPIDQITPIATSDGTDGAIVSWADARNNSNHKPFAQHVLASGVNDPAWPVNGRALGGSSGEEVNHAIVGDGAGGAIVAWEEDSFVIVQRVQASGILDPQFPVDGRFVKNTLAFQERPDLVPAAGGNAIVVWSDGAITSLDNDIYANLVTTSGTVDVAAGSSPSVIRFAPPSPNPAHGALTLRFALPRDASVRLAIYDAGGRRVRDLLSGAQTAGEHAIAWDLHDESGRAAPAGLYFARFEAEGQSLTEKIATVN